MRQLGAAIIGCGWVAGEYVKAFQNDERCELRALVSRHRESAEKYRDQYDLQCAVETGVLRSTGISTICSARLRRMRRLCLSGMISILLL